MAESRKLSETFFSLSRSAPNHLSKSFTKLQASYGSSAATNTRAAAFAAERDALPARAGPRKRHDFLAPRLSLEQPPPAHSSVKRGGTVRRAPPTSAARHGLPGAVLSDRTSPYHVAPAKSNGRGMAQRSQRHRLRSAIQL